MTLEQYFIERLTSDERLADAEAAAVMERVKAAPENKKVSELWGRDCNAFDGYIKIMLWLDIKRYIP